MIPNTDLAVQLEWRGVGGRNGPDPADPPDATPAPLEIAALLQWAPTSPTNAKCFFAASSTPTEPDAPATPSANRELPVLSEAADYVREYANRGLT